MKRLFWLILLSIWALLGWEQHSPGAVLLPGSLYLTNSTSGPALTVSLGWIPSPSPDATGYFMCWGTVSGQATNQLDAGNATNVVVAGLTTNVTYFFTVVTYSSYGDRSVPSNEIQYTAVASGPAGPVLNAQMQSNGTGGRTLTLSFQGTGGTSYKVVASDDLQNWTTIWSTNCVVDQAVTYVSPVDLKVYPRRFFRLVKN